MAYMKTEAIFSILMALESALLTQRGSTCLRLKKTSKAAIGALMNLFFSPQLSYCPKSLEIQKT